MRISTGRNDQGLPYVTWNEYRHDGTSGTGGENGINAQSWLEAKQRNGSVILEFSSTVDRRSHDRALWIWGSLSLAGALVLVAQFWPEILRMRDEYGILGVVWGFIAALLPCFAMAGLVVGVFVFMPFRRPRVISERPLYALEEFRIHPSKAHTAASGEVVVGPVVLEAQYGGDVPIQPLSKCLNSEAEIQELARTLAKAFITERPSRPANVTEGYSPAKPDIEAFA